MARAVVPVRSLSMRLPDAGRIRIGVKGSEGQPQKLDRFRFTSTDPAALQQVADLYGGTVQPWSDPKAGAGQHEVITEAREIRIALPPDPLGNTPIYELWSGGGCQRRCDGETCEILTSGQDGIDLTQVPCMCAANGELACKVTTRLSVLLPEIRFVGVWRLDSHGWNAAQELPGMVELIRTLQDRGVVRGLLRVEERVQTLAGQTRKYMVPALGIDESVEALAAGSARLGALGPAAPALGAGDPLTAPLEPPSPDLDEIFDAELVDDTDALVLLRESATSAAKKGQALRAARAKAEANGIALPLDFDEVRDPVLVAAALEALA